MTATVKVTSHNTPAQVRISDVDNNGEFQTTEVRTLRSADGEQTFHATKTRRVEVLDVEDVITEDDGDTEVTEVGETSGDKLNNGAPDPQPEPHEDGEPAED